VVIYIFVCPVVDTTLLYVCTLWLGIFTKCSPSGLDTSQSIGIICKLFLDVITFSVSFITEGLEDNYYSEEVRKGWKEV
jgi:arginine exporter protein ArgO